MQITEAQQVRINELCKELNLTPEQETANLQALYKVEKYRELSQENAEKYIHTLEATCEKRKGKTNEVKEEIVETKISKPSVIEDNSFQGRLTTALVKEAKSMLPTFNRDRFVSNCWALINSPKSKLDLSKCNPNEIITAFVMGAKCDLEYGKEFYVLPYYNNSDKKYHHEIMFDYKGLLKMITRYADKDVKNILTFCVYKGDEFEVSAFNRPPIKHNMKFETKNNEDITHVYAYIEYHDGGYDFDVLNKEEIDHIMSISKSKDKNGNIVGPWKEWYPEMARKSAVRKLSKRVALNFYKLNKNSDVDMIWNREQEVAYDLNQPKQIEESKVIDVLGGGENV